MSSSLQPLGPEARVGIRSVTGPPEDSTNVKYRTIGGSFSPRHNSLNLIRLILATTVVVDHAVGLGGFKSDPFAQFGPLSVYGFFGISGYLIAASAAHNTVGRYLWQRVVRIFPAFWVCLFLTAFLFGLLAWFKQNPHCDVSCYVRAPLGPLDYLRLNFWLRIDQQGIANTLRGVPFGSAWNGSLWSLFYEFLCYLMLAAFAVSGILRHRWIVAILGVAAWVTELIITWNSTFNAKVNIFTAIDATRLLQLVPIFLAGTLLYLYRDKVPDSFWLAVTCAVLVALSFVIPLDGRSREFGLSLTNVFAPALAYLMVWLGIHLPFHKVGSRNDYSYGIYIYGYPVAQLLAVWGVYHWGVVGFASSVVLLTALFAVGSWWLIEKNALRLKKIRLPRQADPKLKQDPV
jgi:peptidoglycan/LPS O-acetylase OafA/YrhL